MSIMRQSRRLKGVVWKQYSKICVGTYECLWTVLNFISWGVFKTFIMSEDSQPKLEQRPTEYDDANMTFIQSLSTKFAFALITNKI
jgi:hypothetical protein